nr:hypothetical protein [uncultured Roseateles sp.]
MPAFSPMRLDLAPGGLIGRRHPSRYDSFQRPLILHLAQDDQRAH